MIYVTGDCHGNFARFEQKKLPGTSEHDEG